MLENVLRCFKNLRNAWKLLTDLPFVIVWKPSLLSLFNFGFCKASSRMGKTMQDYSVNMGKTSFMFFHSIILLSNSILPPHETDIDQSTAEAGCQAKRWPAPGKSAVLLLCPETFIVIYIIWGRGWRNSTYFCTAHHCTAWYMFMKVKFWKASCDESVTGCWEDGMRCQNMAEFKWQESRDVGSKWSKWSKWSKRQNTFNFQLTFQVPWKMLIS